jgi:diguanylate cyclase (GGDEF)-like protein
MLRRLLFALTYLLRRVTIRSRMIGALVVLSSLPLLVSGYLTFVESSQAIQEQAQVFSTEIVKQVAKNAQLRMAQIDANAETLVLSDGVQSTLSRYGGDSPAEQALAQNAMPGILLKAYGSFDYINQMYFLSSNHRVLDSQVFPQLGSSVEAFASNASRAKAQAYWGTIDLPGGKKGIAMTRQILFKSNNRVAGELYLHIKASHFSEIFDEVSLGDGSDIFVMDALNGSVIVDSRARLARPHQEPPAVELAQALLHAALLQQTTGTLTYQAPTRMEAVYSQIPNTSWYVVNTIPYDNLIAVARTLRSMITLIGSLGLLASVLLSFVTWRSISEPLKQLMGQIQRAEAGTALTPLAHEGRDELTVLSQKFSAMSIRIKREHELLEERVRERTLALEQANQQLEKLSTTDGLTGIANRRQFDAVLATEWRRAARLRQPLALAMIDIDWFKKYNDRYGHQAGDECLRRVATLLALCVMRPGDLVARYGGEEFVFVASATDGPSALRIARNVCEALQALAIPHEASDFGCVTTSIGVAAMFASEDLSAQALLHAADHALYQAKALGRNQAVLYAA